MAQTVRQNVLVVGDRSAQSRLVLAALASKGIHGELVHSARAGCERLKRGRWDLVMSDLEVLGDDAGVFVQQAKQDLPELPIVMISAVRSVTAAVEAMRAGCEDFMVKPITPRDVANLLETLLPSHGVSLAGQCEHGAARCEIIGRDPAFLEMLEVASRVARTSIPVLVTGESGTGKELVTRYIHSRSARAAAPYICVNCAAMAESLLESELFGHERGAFTGACRQRRGLFERAHGGTLMLDEISETGVRFQAELLRVLEQQDFQRVGGGERVHVNVRVIATSNRDLSAEVEAGRFRSDLYYRVGGLHLTVPPLRRRACDVPMLAWHFVNQYARETRRQVKTIDDAMMARLCAHDWPGNVRELRNVVRTALILGEGSELTLTEASPLAATLTPAEGGGGATLALRDVERQAVLEALRRTNSNHTKAAALLGITDRTLRNKLRGYRHDGHLPASGESECLTEIAL